MTPDCDFSSSPGQRAALTDSVRLLVSRSQGLWTQTTNWICPGLLVSRTCTSSCWGLCMDLFSGQGDAAYRDFADPTKCMHDLNRGSGIFRQHHPACAHRYSYVQLAAPVHCARQAPPPVHHLHNQYRGCYRLSAAALHRAVQPLTFTSTFVLRQPVTARSGDLDSSQVKATLCHVDCC